MDEKHQTLQIHTHVDNRFALARSLHCLNFGYTHLYHNEIRDTFATLLEEVCHDVKIELPQENNIN